MIHTTAAVQHHLTISLLMPHLEKAAKEHGLHHPKTVRLSQAIDREIVAVMKAMRGDTQEGVIAP